MLAEATCRPSRPSSGSAGLAFREADIVVCAQSFHWMDPEAALRGSGPFAQARRGFATVDYDWPPVSTAAVEEAFRRFEQETEAATLEAGGLPASTAAGENRASGSDPEMRVFLP